MDVDKARRDVQAGGVQGFTRLHRRRVADGQDAPVLDRYICRALPARAIQHGAVADQQIDVHQEALAMVT